MDERFQLISKPSAFGEQLTISRKSNVVLTAIQSRSELLKSVADGSIHKLAGATISAGDGSGRSVSVSLLKGGGGTSVLAYESTSTDIERSGDPTIRTIRFARIASVGARNCHRASSS
jgi:hypothetical protein